MPSYLIIKSKNPFYDFDLIMILNTLLRDFLVIIFMVFFFGKESLIENLLFHPPRKKKKPIILLKISSRDS